ncbi:MAG: PQQ-dependent sugar dehydrogenase [Litorivicinus sp.]
MKSIAVLLAIAAFTSIGSATAWAGPTLKKVAGGLNHPWSIAFESEQSALVTERNGDVLRIDLRTGERQRIANTPKRVSRGQGGYFDIALAPNYERSGVAYLALNGGSALGMGLELWRGTISGNAWTQSEQLYAMEKSLSARHFGGRIQIDGDFLYLSTGDRGDRPRAQDPNDSAGNILRFTLDGQGAGIMPGHPALYSMGHRNVQGLTLVDGELWAHEHGPQGGDELNRIRGGQNHGWPRVTYGKNYGLGTRIGEATELDGFASPAYQWTPSIAPSGMAYYTGSEHPQWHGSWLIGALKFQTLVQLTPTQDGWDETRWFTGAIGRIRDIKVSPEGAVWVLSDSQDGSLYRVTRAQNATD